MKRILLATVAAIALLAVSAVASVATSTTTSPVLGSTVPLGVTRSPLVPPTCPKGVSEANCTIVLTRSTALETIRDGVSYPTTVTQPGLIVAWTVGLSRLSNSTRTADNSIRYLDATFHGNAEAGITVLGPVGASSLHEWRVVAHSPFLHVQPWLGYVVQFPLATPLPVTAGDVIALTTPTWVPVLSFDLSPTEFAYRQSRTANCAGPAASNQAQLTVGESTRYLCSYPGTRVEYGAAEVTQPPLPDNQLHATDNGLAVSRRRGSVGRRRN